MCSISWHLGKATLATDVLVHSLRNDVMGYIPSRQVRDEGGYEATEAMRYSRTHPAPWAPTLEERIIGKVHELDRGLSR